VVRQDTYVELPVDERAIPFWARRKLRRARREGRTGMVAYTRIAGGARGMPWMTRVVSVREGRDRLFYGWPKAFQLAKWIDLVPGEHRLKFGVAGYGEVVFERTVVLARHDVLIAGCRTSYTRLPRKENRPPNRWYLGIVGPEPRPDYGSTWPVW
jgi:hypothetical protein